MWLNEQLNRASAGEPAFWGRVTALRGNTADITAHTRLANAPCVSAFGTAALPGEGDEVLVLPTANGYACIGSTTAAADAGPADREIRLENAAGACIRLLADGCILLNGLRITPEGKISP